MTLVHRKRISSTLSSDNFEFISDLSEKTGLNQSKLFDLSVQLLKKELETTDLLELISKHKVGK